MTFKFNRIDVNFFFHFDLQRAHAQQVAHVHVDIRHR